MSNTFGQFLSLSSIKQFDFISIDAEGYDLIILKQINLKELGCKCICIEHNSDSELIIKYQEYMNNFNMRSIHLNAENIIFAI
jgi:hypothetical protein